MKLESIWVDAALSAVGLGLVVGGRLDVAMLPLIALLVRGLWYGSQGW
jgi:hypothetical protein